MASLPASFHIGEVSNLQCQVILRVRGPGKFVIFDVAVDEVFESRFICNPGVFSEPGIHSDILLHCRYPLN